MKKIILVSLLLLLLSGCNEATKSFGFVDFGIADKTNFIVARDKNSVAWVEDKLIEIDGNLLSVVFVADKDGGNKKIVYSRNYAAPAGVRPQGLVLLGYFPEDKVIVLGRKDLQTKFDIPTYTNVMWKFLDSPEEKSLTDNFAKFIKTSKGIFGYRIGHSISYYQVSVDNYFAVDSVLNYEKDKVKAENCVFADIKVSLDNSKLAYLFKCNKNGELNDDNKIIISDIEGNNRKVLINSKEDLSLVNFLGSNKVKYRENNIEKVSDI